MPTSKTIPELPKDQTEEAKVPHRRWIPWVLMAAFAVIAGFGWVAAQRRAREEAALQAAQARAAALRPIPVTAANVVREDVPVYLTGLGSVTAYNTVAIQPRVSGQIMQIFFREGQHVQAGQLLAQIDPRPYQVQLQQAQGQLAHDQAQLSDAQLDLQRDQALFASGIIPRQQLDAQQALVGQYQGSIISDKAQIANAQLNLQYCKLRAPISGKVGLRMVDVGNIVQPTSTLVIITQMQPIAVIFTLPEEQLTPILQGLRAGRSFAVVAYDRADTHPIAAGSLLATDNLINQTTGTLRLKARFANPDEVLFPNEFVNVHIRTEVLRNALVIPAAALEHTQQGDYVYVVRPDRTVEERAVKAELTQGNLVVVSSGVKEGETVVTDGQDKLRQGSHVLPQIEGPVSSAGGQAS